MTPKASLCALALLLISCQAIQPWGPRDLLSQLNPTPPPPAYNQTQLWFTEQLVDHYNYSSNATWSQRYWVVSDFFNQENGPVFLYICGEYTCPGVNPQRLFPVELAQTYGALILVLEHRFYGNSQPTGDLTVESLRLLNADQALEDLAYFMSWTQNNQVMNLTIGTNLSWISIGGSYPGALSAWFRSKYPYLTVGALASSAVVNSITDFWQFDYQVYVSTMKSGPQCVSAIQALNQYAEAQLASNSTAFKSQFNASLLNDGEFLFYFVDTIAELVQYGNRTWLCNTLANYSTPQEQLQVLQAQAYVNNDPTAYGSYYLSNTTYDPNNQGARQWYWQVCSEVGWFNTAPQNNSMRPSSLNMTFYEQWCQDSYGESVFPNGWTQSLSLLANLDMGGIGIQATNLIMTNGCEDPWQWASLNTSQNGINAIYTDCDDCAHCVELYTPTPNDSPNLVNTRAQVTKLFGEWLGVSENDWELVQMFR